MSAIAASIVATRRGFLHMLVQAVNDLPKFKCRYAAEQLLLIRIRLAGFNHADVMVGEFEVQAGRLDLRHVTTRAPRSTPGRTGRRGAIFCRGRCSVRLCLMAGQTLRVIEGRVVARVGVRIVAGGATDAAVIGVLITLAVGEAIRLEAHVR